MKFLCDPLVKLTCHGKNSSHQNNSCNCVQNDKNTEKSVIHISYSSIGQKNEICNHINKFGILPFVDFEKTCEQHQDNHK